VIGHLLGREGKGVKGLFPLEFKLLLNALKAGLFTRGWRDGTATRIVGAFAVRIGTGTERLNTFKFHFKATIVGRHFDTFIVDSVSKSNTFTILRHFSGHGETIPLSRRHRGDRMIFIPSGRSQEERG
jgi:hypothetical protein